MSLNSLSQAEAHYSGKAHLKKLQAKANVGKPVVEWTQKKKVVKATAKVGISNIQNKLVQQAGGQQSGGPNNGYGGQMVGYQPPQQPPPPPGPSFQPGPPPGLPNFHAPPPPPPSGPPPPPPPHYHPHSQGEDYQPPAKMSRWGAPPPQPPQPPPTGPGKLDPVSQAVLDNMMGVLPTKRVKLEIPCKICSLIFNSEDQAAQHFAGAKHQKKKKMAEEKSEVLSDRCDVCEKDFNSKHQALQHFSSKKHATKAKMVADGDIPDPSKKVPVKKATFRCEFCQLDLNSQDQLDVHRTGDKHRKSVELAAKKGGSNLPNQPGIQVIGALPGQKPNWLHCQLCDISVPTAAKLHMHVNSPEHREKKSASSSATSEISAT